MNRRILLAPVAVLLIGGTAVARDADQALACLAANAPEKTFSYQADFLTRDRNGDERPLSAQVLGKRDAGSLLINLGIREPAALTGTAFLIRETDGQDDMRIYLPAMNRVRRVTGSMAARELLGTSFSYLNIKQMFGAFLDGARETLADGEHLGRAVHRVRIVPTPEEGAPFQSLMAYIDAETCVPLGVDFLDADGELLKQLEATVGTLRELDGRHLATEYRMRDLLNGTETTVRFSDLSFDESIRGTRFSPNSFYR